MVGAMRHQGLLQESLAETIVVSDDGGQFGVGANSLCWVPNERLVQ